MPAKRALVTGASTGIGREFATLLAQAGYDLAIVARSEGPLRSLAADLVARYGIGVESIVCDLGAPGAAQEVAARVPACDVLVNNAGFANNGRYAEIDQDRISSEIRLDVEALAALTRLYLPGMLARKAGKILNVSSTAAFLPGPFMAVYYASKAFVLSFSQALAEEVRATGVTVTCLCPGATATEFFTRAQMQSTLLTRMRMATPAAVAKAGIEGMMRGKAIVIPGAMNHAAAMLSRIAPRRLLIAVSRRLVQRPQ